MSNTLPSFLKRMCLIPSKETNRSNHFIMERLIPVNTHIEGKLSNGDTFIVHVFNEVEDMFIPVVKFLGCGSTHVDSVEDLMTIKSVLSKVFDVFSRAIVVEGKFREAYGLPMVARLKQDVDMPKDFDMVTVKEDDVISKSDSVTTDNRHKSIERVAGFLKGEVSVKNDDCFGQPMMGTLVSQQVRR